MKYRPSLIFAAAIILSILAHGILVLFSPEKEFQVSLFEEDFFIYIDPVAIKPPPPPPAPEVPEVIEVPEKISKVVEAVEETEAETPPEEEPVEDLPMEEPADLSDSVVGEDPNGTESVESAFNGEGNGEKRFFSKMDVDIKPVFIEVAPQVYPQMAKAQGISNAMVVVILELDENGEIISLEFANKVGFGFEEAAEKFLRGGRFSPAYLDGHPVPVRTPLSIFFRLE